MTEIVDLRNAADPRDAIHRAASHLAEGRLIALPTESGYVVAGHLLQEAAVESMFEASKSFSTRPPGLTMRSPGEIHDYVPNLPGIAERLIRRCWPGPVVLEFEGLGDAGLLNSVPNSVRQILFGPATIGFASPADEAHRALCSLSTAPVVYWLPQVEGRNPAATLEECLHRVADRVSYALDAGSTRFDSGPTIISFSQDSWQIESEGVISAASITRMAAEMIVFVCTGNTCRSPMAEGLFRKILANRLKSDEDSLEEQGYLVLSAGLAAGAGLAASPESVNAVREFGIDLSSHLSRPLTNEIILQADRIYTMTRQHREMIVQSFPDAGRRTQLLAQDGQDVVDPIGQGQGIYDECRQQIERNLRVIAEAICTRD